MSALSNLQKKNLAQLATRAFNLARARLLGDAAARVRLEGVTVAGAPDQQTALEVLLLDGRTTAQQYWRHAQVGRAVGKEGLRCCDQLDYKAVEAHFLDLINQPGKALNSLVRAASEPRRQAEAVLLQRCRHWGFDLNYAASICRTQFKCSLFDASDKQIWNLVYTINNRGKRKKEREAQQHQEAL